MTERKFTPPIVFPAEYQTGTNLTATVVAQNPTTGYLVGFVNNGVAAWNQHGSCVFCSYASDSTQPYNLCDMQKKQVTWANDYGKYCGDWYMSRARANSTANKNRIAVIRREWVEGEAPQYFTEEV